MDFMLERWINRPAGTHPPLDVLMVHVAGWAEPLFSALVILWFLLGWLRGLPRDRQGAITALSGAGVALLFAPKTGKKMREDLMKQYDAAMPQPVPYGSCVIPAGLGTPASIASAAATCAGSVAATHAWPGASSAAHV